jgi:hypothetical protein
VLLEIVKKHAATVNKQALIQELHEYILVKAKERRFLKINAERFAYKTSHSVR